MMDIRFAATRSLCLAAFAAALTGCVSEGFQNPGNGMRAPRMATYQCDDGGTLRVENRGNSVQLQTPRGVEVTLPASPPDSTSRYGDPPYALILDGREALWFVTGKHPLTCRR